MIKTIFTVLNAYLLRFLGNLLLKEITISDDMSHELGNDMMKLMHDLFPICRSITGDGVRKTLEIINEYVLVEKFEISSGKKVFDWIIPDEWNITDGYIIDPNGEKIVDFKKLNLHVLNYSTPIDTIIELSELKKHIFTDPDMPERVPYVTSYYKKNWGFCMSHNQLLGLKDGTYKIKIDSVLKSGSLTFGEFFIKGKSEEEILISTYICHPSLCNDNLSGIVLCTMLAKFFKKIPLNHSVRFLFIPETIGAVTWLSLNEKNLHKIKHGLNISDIGNKGDLIYKKSRRGNAKVDIVVPEILNKTRTRSKIVKFFPYGSDERQFCSPGLNLPVGHLMREFYDTSVNGVQKSGYHTSGDDFSIISQESLQEAFNICVKIIFELDNSQMMEQDDTESKDVSDSNTRFRDDEYFYNLRPKCEPQLGKYNIYDEIGGMYNIKKKELKFAILWVLNYSDGNHSLQNIAKKSEIKLEIIRNAAEILKQKGLISEFHNKSIN